MGLVQILTPVQCARCVVQAWPWSPDTLAICSWVAVEEGDSGAIDLLKMGPPAQHIMAPGSMIPHALQSTLQPSLPHMQQAPPNPAAQAVAAQQSYMAGEGSSPHIPAQDLIRQLYVWMFCTPPPPPSLPPFPMLMQPSLQVVFHMAVFTAPAPVPAGHARHAESCGLRQECVTDTMLAGRFNRAGSQHTSKHVCMLLRTVCVDRAPDCLSPQ